jgi:hypothetical protein
MKFGIPLVPVVVYVDLGMQRYHHGGLFVGGWPLLVIA